jgi:hypothetical protein
MKRDTFWATVLWPFNVLRVIWKALTTRRDKT